MNRNLQISLSHIIHVEGSGFVDRSDDRGGPTRYGVTIPMLSAFRQREVTARDIRDLGEMEARDVYVLLFWNKLRCDDLPDGLDLAVFDAAVHAGQGQATKWLQQSCNLLRSNGPWIDDDGVLGSRTMAARPP